MVVEEVPKRDQIIGYIESILVEDDNTYKMIKSMENIMEEEEYQTCMMDLPDSFFKGMLVELHLEQCYVKRMTQNIGKEEPNEQKEKLPPKWELIFQKEESKSHTEDEIINQNHEVLLDRSFWALIKMASSQVMDDTGGLCVYSLVRLQH
uniref:Uncharacterized protein n=1 Tax=Romanomermis culicivorax TaxID=13658 RepID=A0A915L1U5_ROMCU